jgi:hypothetical protein
MSELKEIGIRWEENGELHFSHVYPKYEADKVIAHQKYKRCLAMAKWCEATALWCYQAANTLPAGFHATLYGKPVMIEPARLFKRFELLSKWNKRWLELAELFKEGK